MQNANTTSIVINYKILLTIILYLVRKHKLLKRNSCYSVNGYCVGFDWFDEFNFNYYLL